MPVEPQAPYISSKQAAKKYGLTNDHIGLLCRKNKVKGLLWGRVWYVSEPSLKEYLEKSSALKEERKQRLSKQWHAAWSAAFIGFIIFAFSVRSAAANYVTPAPTLKPQPSELEVNVVSLSAAAIEFKNSMPVPHIPQLAETYSPPPAGEPFLLQVGDGLYVLGEGMANIGGGVVRAFSSEPQTRVTYAKNFKKPAQGPTQFVRAIRAAATTASVTLTQGPKQRPVAWPLTSATFAQSPSAVTTKAPLFTAQNMLAGTVATNESFDALNRAMFGAYAQSVAQLARDTQFDAAQGWYVYDHIFGEFGRQYVGDLQSLNGLQVRAYLSAGDAVVNGYDVIADAIDTLPPIGIPVSVASVAGAPGDDFAGNLVAAAGQMTASVWSGAVDWLSNIFVAVANNSNKLAQTSSNNAPVQTPSQNSLDQTAPTEILSKSSSDLAARPQSASGQGGARTSSQGLLPAPSFVTQDSLNKQLDAWMQMVRALIPQGTGAGYVDNPASAALGAAGSGSTVVNNYFGVSQKIDKLDGVTITNSSINGVSDFSHLGGGASALTDLSDTLVASPAYGDVLVFNGSKWANVATSSLGIVSNGGGGSSFAYPFPSNATSTRLTLSGGFSATYASTTALSASYASSTALYSSAYYDQLGNLLVYTNSNGTNRLLVGQSNNNAINFGDAFHINFPNYTGYGAGYLTIDTGGTIGVSASVGSSFAYPFSLGGYGTTTGLGIFASTTIGNGSQAGGLTISGGATTTGNAIFGGNVGIGSTSPYASLSINANNGSLSTTLFAIGSSTQSATTTLFSVANNGFTTIAGPYTASSTVGSTTIPAALEVQGDIVSKGTVWTLQTSAANSSWMSVAYGNGLFVAVGTAAVMTSPDGINWTSQTALSNSWNSVTYGNGTFVAVASSGNGNRVMTSPDGVNWSYRASASNSSWQSVTYGNGLFVAVGSSAVMSSPDGINWTARSPAVAQSWNSVAYGNGVFVAVATGAWVMTSTDGVNWTSLGQLNGNTWQSVTYGNGLFVTVPNGGSGNRFMTSPDGTNWSVRISPVSDSWKTVTYGNGLFVAISNSAIVTSPDGLVWTARTNPASNTWRSAVYGNGTFVAVASSGNGNRVMTSGKNDYISLQNNNIYQGGLNLLSGNLGIGTSSPFAALALQAWAAASTTAVNTTLFNISSSTALDRGAATSTLFTITNTGNVGLGTSTPWSRLSIDTSSLAAAVPEFFVGSTTRADFIINQNGNVGVGTTSPYAKLSVVGDIVGATVNATSTTATSTIAGGLNVGSGAITYDFSSGITSINNLALGSFTFDTDAGIVSWADLPISSTPSAGTVESYSADVGGSPVLTVYGESDGSGNAQNLRVGVGTSSPSAIGGVGAYVTIDKSATAQYALLTFATSTGSVTQAAFANGNGVVGSVSTNGSATAYNTSSDRRIKAGIASTTLGLSTLMELPVRDFSFLNDPAHATTTGFIAQELFKVFPYAVTTNGDDGLGALATGTLPWSVDYGRITPLIVKAVQDIADITSNFKTNLINWLADASNGITKLFAGEVHTNELCVKKSDGEDICVTGDQLAAVLARNISAQSPASASGSGNTPALSDMPTLVPITPAPEATSTPDTPAPPVSEATTTDATSTPQ